MRSSNSCAVLALVASAACSNSSSPAAPDAAASPDAAVAAGYSPSLAKWEFWSAYHAGNIDAIAPARDHMIAAMATDAQDDELPRLVGMSYLLTGLEGSMAGGNPMQSAQEQGMYLDQARGLAVDPYAKALDTTLYSGYPFFVGQQQGDMAQTQQALDLMAQGKAQYPVLGNFSSATIMLRAPRDTPYYAQAVEAYFDYFELCTGTTIDRTSPDLTAMLNGTTIDPLCQNPRNVPHALQGGMFLFADVLVKNNQVAAATTIYQQIKQSTGFATCKYRDAVDQRLSSYLVARAASYDPANATPPPLGATPCLACHGD